MAGQVQELIDKIKAEGITAAEEKAKEIESNAQRAAQKIVDEANRKAEQIVGQAKEETHRLREAAQLAVKQAARDVLLSLRKKIEKTLTNVVGKEVADALDSQRLAHIIETVAKSSVGAETDDGLEIAVGAKEAAALKNGFVAKLQKEIKKNNINIASADDISRGFTISFDDGKSCFDFTDESLTEYLCAFLNPQVAALVKESA